MNLNFSAKMAGFCRDSHKLYASYDTVHTHFDIVHAHLRTVHTLFTSYDTL